MAQRVQQELDGSDAALLMLNGEQGVGQGDRFIARELARRGTARDLAVNKVDRLARAATSPSSTTPPSSTWARMSSRSPPGPAPASRRSSTSRGADARGALPVRARTHLRPAARRAARRAHSRGRRSGAPSRSCPTPSRSSSKRSSGPREDLARVRALIWVESESQKAIVVGARGRMIKAIGTAARRALERELGCHVYLDLSVRVRRDWRGGRGLARPPRHHLRSRRRAPPER